VRVVPLVRPSSLERAFVPSITVVSSSSSSVPIARSSASPRVVALLAVASIVPIPSIVPIVATTILVPIPSIVPIVPIAVALVRAVARHHLKTSRPRASIRHSVPASDGVALAVRGRRQR
jgi:hypothetical protein